MLEVKVARLSGNGETRRDGQANTRHFRQACTLAAEYILHLSVAFGLPRSKKINVSHLCPRLFRDSVLQLY
jgi:hypothetical protein